jgi:hypothetical protein
VVAEAMSARRAVRRTVIRSASAVLAAWGVVLVARPEAVVRAVAPGQASPPTWLVRLLGARLVVQHAAVFAVPRRGPVLAGAAVDVLHASSMAGVAALAPNHRRSALVSGSTSAASAAVGLLAAPLADHS